MFLPMPSCSTVSLMNSLDNTSIYPGCILFPHSLSTRHPRLTLPNQMRVGIGWQSGGMWLAKKQEAPPERGA